MAEHRSVRRLLGTPLWATTVVVLLIGLAGFVSVLASTRAVNFLSDELTPAVSSNSKVLQDLLQMQTAVRGHAISGDRRTLEDYRSARDRLPSDEAALEAYAQKHRALEGLVSRQRTQTRAWLDDYVPQLALSRATGRPRDRVLYGHGDRLFDDVRETNQEIRSQLAKASDAAHGQAKSRLAATIVLNSALSLLGGGLLLAVGWWATNRIRRPLRDLEDMVARMNAGDDDVRVEPSGPREIHSVGEALNELAEERNRGRDVEAEVRSQLREIDLVKTDFVSNVSHELRTPLTIIAGYLELLEEDLGPRVTGEQASMLDVTGRNVDRLRDLIEDLLTLNEAENRGTVLREVDLGKLLNEVGTDMRFTAASKKVAIRLARTDSPTVVLADPSQLHRAMLNIVANAVKFSVGGGTVRVDVRRVAGRAVIRVCDEGIGVPAEELPRLGSRFYRASNAVAQAVAGTGLGLRIVQTILDNHDGSLALDSVEGTGTTVTIGLPLLAGDSGPVRDREETAGSRR